MASPKNQTEIRQKCKQYRFELTIDGYTENQSVIAGNNFEAWTRIGAIVGGKFGEVSLVKLLETRDMEMIVTDA